MNHGLETHVDPTGSNHLSYIGRIVGFENSDGDSFLLEVTLGLGKEERSVVRGSFPVKISRKVNRNHREQKSVFVVDPKKGGGKVHGVPVEKKADLVGSSRHGGAVLMESVERGVILGEKKDRCRDWEPSGIVIRESHSSKD